MKKKDYSKAHLFSLSLFSNSKQSLLKTLLTLLNNSSKTTYIFTPNPEQIVQADTNPEFKKALSQAHILLPDGVGLVWASRIIRLFDSAQTIISQRISGREIAHWLLLQAYQKKKRVLVIGGRGYDCLQNVGFTVIDSTFPLFEIEYQIPNCSVSTTVTNTTNSNFRFFWTHGYETIQHPTKTEDQNIEKIIKKIQPHIIFVAFGAPWQELWLMQHRSLLQSVHTSIGMAVGGAFDTILGKTPLVPNWIERFGFEWLFRLVTQPWRWKRQLRLFIFMKMVLFSILNIKFNKN